jgi:hypothetical protein
MVMVPMARSPALLVRMHLSQHRFRMSATCCRAWAPSEP